MLISTTPSIEGKIIKEYRGIVFGEVVNGIHYMQDFSAGITNAFGGRSTAYEQELINTRADAITEMMRRAEKVGANAIVGVKFDYETLREGTMLAVIASGTAVILE